MRCQRPRKRERYNAAARLDSSLRRVESLLVDGDSHNGGGDAWQGKGGEYRGERDMRAHHESSRDRSKHRADPADTRCPPDAAKYQYRHSCEYLSSSRLHDRNGELLIPARAAPPAIGLTLRGSGAVVVAVVVVLMAFSCGVIRWGSDRLAFRS